jgi:hypothetical protein
MKFIICGNGPKSNEDIKICRVDEFRDEVLGTFRSGELIPILNIGVEVKILSPLKQFLHLLGLDVELLVVELVLHHFLIIVDGPGQRLALSCLLSLLHLLNQLRLLRLLALHIQILQPLQLSLSEVLFTNLCFLKYFSLRSSFLWW